MSSESIPANEYPDRIGFVPDNPYLATFKPYIPAGVRLPELTALPLIIGTQSEEHTSELQSLTNLVCRLLLEKKKNNKNNPAYRTVRIDRVAALDQQCAHHRNP